MDKHVSYGVVPLQQREEEWVALVIQREKGFWEFPKGHAEKGEEPLEAAQRELLEETGLSITNLLFNTPLSIHYIFNFKGTKVEKTVYYFIAEVAGGPTLQKEEVQNCRWLPLSEAEEQLTFENSKQICREVSQLLSSC